jgi:hypothetical protein
MVPSQTAVNRLVVPGHVVGSTDGQPWLVLSRMNTKDGAVYKLADLMGSPIPTPPHFDPVPFRIARIASLIRLAYNRQFDDYVKDSIRQAGLPVDQDMNWAKYLYKILASKLPTHDEEIIDETIHEIIIRVLLNRHALDPNNPNGFQQKIQGFKWAPGQTEELPLEKQVTEFLKKSFRFRKEEAIKYAERLQGGEGETDPKDFLSTEAEGDEDTSPIETIEHGTGMQDFQHTEENLDLGDYRSRDIHSTKGTFSEGFKAWLLNLGDRIKKKYSLPIVRQYMRLLTLLHDETKSVGKYPKLKDIEAQWKKLQDRHEASRNRLNHEGFEKLFNSLPIAIEAYVRTHYHGQESTLPPLIRVLNRMGSELRQKKLEESDRDREERRRQKEEGGFPEQPVAEPTPATEEAAMHDLPPETRLSSQKKQFEVPSCKNCGNNKEPKRCKGCQEYFCSECMHDHHANFPGHDGVL